MIHSGIGKHLPLPIMPDRREFGKTNKYRNVCQKL
jgi:hypothetical protein